MKDVLCELEECIPSVFDVEDTINEKELTILIEKFLCLQPKLKRNLFVKRYWYMNSVKEISSEFNISENKVATILYRMRKDLKNILKTEGYNL